MTFNGSTIALFGATGGTGSEFLKMALEEGYKVRAMVRTPDKLNESKDHELITVIKGSFDDQDKIEETVQGADYVISMAGMPPGMGKKYPKDVMRNFVSNIYKAFEKTPPTKLFLFQSGQGSTNADGEWMWSQFLLRFVLGPLVGFGPGVTDNDGVAKFMKDNQSDKFNWMVTHAGALAPAKEGASPVALKATYGAIPPVGFYTFTDVARFTLKAMKDESLYNTCPFVVADK